jgi:hypothetical protein
MSIKKPSNEEEEYFAREEAQKKHQLAVEATRKMEESDRLARQKLHFMKCPKCGYDLETIKFKDFAIDKCFNCNGTWLDAGELEALAGRDPGNLVERLVAVFKR